MLNCHSTVAHLRISLLLCFFLFCFVIALIYNNMNRLWHRPCAQLRHGPKQWPISLPTCIRGYHVLLTPSQENDKNQTFNFSRVNVKRSSYICFLKIGLLELTLPLRKRKCTCGRVLFTFLGSRFESSERKAQWNTNKNNNISRIVILT